MKKKFLWIVIMGALLLCACGPSASGPSPKPSVEPAQNPGIVPESSASPTSSAAVGAAKAQKITAEQAYQMMQGSQEYILVDVRTQEEFDEEHIEGAMLIPDFEIASTAEAKLPDKGAVILVYCRSGRRSALAASELAAMGYTNLYDFGGIIDWPYDTVS